MRWPGALAIVAVIATKFFPSWAARNIERPSVRGMIRTPVRQLPRGPCGVGLSDRDASARMADRRKAGYKVILQQSDDNHQPAKIMKRPNQFSSRLIVSLSALTQVKDWPGWKSHYSEPREEITGQSVAQSAVSVRLG